MPVYTPRPHVPGHTLKTVAAAVLLLLPACQPELLKDHPQSPAARGYSPKDTDKLLIVDCLLPGQVRKLGTQMTYISQRRPIKTTAGDCEIRGGEYVAFDRANYQTALNMWLPLAQAGDAEAQVSVGEIYEKGLGREPDPAAAADWYLKAAQQGNAKAQINLGYLYEKGLGVAQDLPTALNWYRKASGLEGSDLQFTSVIESRLSTAHEQELEALRQDALRRQKEADALRKQLESTRQQLLKHQQEVADLQRKLSATQRKLDEERRKPAKDESLIKSLEQELKAKQSSLESRREELSKLEQKLVVQEKYVKKERTVARDQEQQLVQKLGAASPPSVASSYQALVLARQELDENEALLERKEADYHSLFIDIKRDLAQLSKAPDASQGGDKGALRTTLDTEKERLQALGKEIGALKKRVEAQRRQVAELEAKQPTQVALAGPTIEIIDPPMTLTRGVPSFQLRSAVKSMEIIGRVSVPETLIKLTVNDAATKPDGQGLFRSMVPVSPPATDVKVVAIDKFGKHSRLEFKLLAKDDTAVVDGAGAPAPAGKSLSYKAIDFGRFYALIIGNNDYAELPTLKTAVNDAMAVEKVLKERYGFKTTLLINANRHQVMTALNTLRTTLTDKDNLLIFYAGHGERDKQDLSAYWLPVDAELDNTANWISSHSITQYLNVMAAKHILVVSDSCYSGAMTRTSLARLPDNISEEKREKWLRFMVGRKTRTVLTSGGVKPVLDQGDGTHSIFARPFIEALRSNTGLLEDYDIYRQVSGQVKASAASVGFDQTPEYAPLQHAGHEGSPFFFVPAAI